MRANGVDTIIANVYLSLLVCVYVSTFEIVIPIHFPITASTYTVSYKSSEDAGNVMKCTDAYDTSLWWKYKPHLIHSFTTNTSKYILIIRIYMETAGALVDTLMILLVAVKHG